MFSKINSFSTRGIDGYRITVEVDVSNGLPSFACRRSGSRSIYRQPGCGKRERGVIWRSRQEF